MSAVPIKVAPGDSPRHLTGIPRGGVRRRRAIPEPKLPCWEAENPRMSDSAREDPMLPLDLPLSPPLMVCVPGLTYWRTWIRGGSSLATYRGDLQTTHKVNNGIILRGRLPFSESCYMRKTFHCYTNRASNILLCTQHQNTENTEVLKGFTWLYKLYISLGYSLV